MHLFHALCSLDEESSDRQGACDAVAATQVSMMLHIDTVTGRVTPI